MKRVLQRVDAALRAGNSAYGSLGRASLRIANVQSRGVRGQQAELHYDGQANKFETSLAGTGNLYNIAAAACVALTCDLKWQEILKGINKSPTLFAARAF